MDLNDTEPTLDEDDIEEELETPAEVVQKFEEIWINEKLAPELLKYETEIVNCLIDQIQHMENSLQRVKKDDFRSGFHKMELDRIKYVLNSYLRIRVEKIEKYCAYLLNTESEDPSLRHQMSPEEKKFAKEYTRSIKEHLHHVGLQNMPSNMQSLPLEQLGYKPQLDKSVFIKAKKECRGVLLEEASEDGEEEIVDLQAGSQHILRYKSIASLLKRGAVQLI